MIFDNTPVSYRISGYRFTGIDILKLVCAIFVCIVHIPPFSGDFLSVGNHINFILRNGLCRIAVPFFFCCSGFFLFRKIDPKSPDYSTVLKYGLKILRLLLLWLVILFWDSNSHLWYLSALIISIALITLFIFMKLDLRTMVVIAAVLYAVGLLGESYYSLVASLPPDNIIAKFFAFYFLHFRSTRNGIFFSPVFLLIGALFAKKEILLKRKTLLFGSIISFILLICEPLLLRHFSLAKDYNMTLAMIPSVFFMMYAATHLKCPETAATGQLSHIGAIIYFIHPAVERLCYFLRVYLSSLGIIWYQALYSITIVCLSWAIAYLIVKLAGNRRTAFLRYLFT